jgi:SAM-dependent methyltransferase
MHVSAYEAMRRCVDEFLPTEGRLTIVDFGSHTLPARLEEQMIHRRLLGERECTLIGVDVREGPNVDLVMKKPYRVPLRSNSVDAVISGQVFEHIPFFWASTLEIARLLKPGGVFLMSVPSRGRRHTAVDCWRYYPDGIRAMAAFAGLEVLKATTDFPPRSAGPDDAYHRTPEHYWGDTIGVFRKPLDYPHARMGLVRTPLLWWANRAAGDFVSSVEVRRARRARRARRRDRRARRARRVARREARAARRKHQP